MSKTKLESTSVAFIYDGKNNLVSATIIEAIDVPGGMAYTLGGFIGAERAQERLDEMKSLASAHADAPLGWLSSTTGRVRCFIIPPHEFPVGNLLSYLEAIEKIFFEKHPEDEAEGFSINVKPNATRS